MVRATLIPLWLRARFSDVCQASFRSTISYKREILESLTHLLTFLLDLLSRRLWTGVACYPSRYGDIFWREEYPPQAKLRLSQIIPVLSLRYDRLVVDYKFTDYFENEVLRKRPYLKKEWCIRVLEKPIRSEPQENNRYRFWAEIPELEGRFLRVITLEDKLTIHNAFPDRRFKP